MPLKIWLGVFGTILACLPVNQILKQPSTYHSGIFQRPLQCDIARWVSRISPPYPGESFRVSVDETNHKSVPSSSTRCVFEFLTILHYQP
eukprot:COSAG02_NODE_168_length_31711_cov_68.337973_26_plen_90_part_00